MALDFPSSPTTGQIYNNWVWDGAKWNSLMESGPFPHMTIGTAPPGTPVAGDFWWDSTGGNLYVWYNDGTSTQWVPASIVTGPPGAQGVPGPTAVSADTSNLARLGSDSLLYVPVLPNYLGGLTLISATTTTFQTSIGGAASDDNTAMMRLTTALTKSISSAWAVGNGNGALDTGAIAVSTWYHVFLIQRPDTRNTDVLISTSPTAPTLPANYTNKRRIGSICTDGSANLLAWLQVGDYFERRDTMAWDVSNGSVSTTWTNFAVHAPHGIRTVVTAVTMFWGTTAGVGWVQMQGTDNTLAAAYPNLSNLDANAVYTCTEVKVPLNTDAQIQAYGSAASAFFYFRVMGWTDTRGK